MPSENAYSQPVTLKNVLKFAVPTIVMTVFMSFYTMIDGLFVSNLLGTDALSAINLSAPIISLVTAVSTMLATGGSMELSYQAMLTKGHPSEIHVASIIASQRAVDHIASILPEDKTTIWCAAIDPEINEHSYIVPGLGDAGDLAFGEKE